MKNQTEMTDLLNALQAQNANVELIARILLFFVAVGSAFLVLYLLWKILKIFF